MKKKRKKVFILFTLSRYLILLVAGIFLSVFYKIFLPLTIWPVYYLLNIFYDVFVSGNIIFVSGLKIEIISACVAGSAYFLLLILNLTTNMKSRQRLCSLIFSFLALLIFNILRIFFLSLLFIKNFAFFDITHKLFWYAFSIIFVVGIWFLTSWIFKIKNIPVYSDFKSLLKN